MFSARDLFISKLYRERATGRTLPFAEALALPLALTYDSQALVERGIEVIDNSAEEIRELAVEMLDRLEGKAVYTADDEELQRRWKGRIRAYGPDEVMARVGRDYCRRHRALLVTS